MRFDIHPYELVLTALNKLQKENAILKEKIKAMELQNIASDVSDQIDEWLNKPYQDKSEREDIENFALKITNYIDNKLKT